MIDKLFAEFVHMLYLIGGNFFTFIFSFISCLAEKGWIFIVFALLLCLRKRTRWIGVTIIFCIGTSYLIADKVIKPLVARERPYMSGDNELYSYWKDVGAIEDTNYSMPSGHVVATAGFFTTLLISCGKKIRKEIGIIGIIFTVIMIIVRCYFMHHYFTDCIAGVVFAIIISFISKAIVKVIYKFCKTYENIPIFNFILNFDIADLFVRKK